MKKVKYNEVPKDYRRNYKKEIIEYIQITLVGGGFGAAFMLIIAMGL